jgi:hypothetical protein
MAVLVCATLHLQPCGIMRLVCHAFFRFCFLKSSPLPMLPLRKSDGRQCLWGKVFSLSSCQLPTTTLQVGKGSLLEPQMRMAGTLAITRWQRLPSWVTGRSVAWVPFAHQRDLPSTTFAWTLWTGISHQVRQRCLHFMEERRWLALVFAWPGHG